uniref:Nucleolus and neural progenitor protein-like N-terminal domain-containing protein n=1 Tax=Leptobrachium leishanense TaxID=445787 RepID=A0A8C5P762_9ANUR
TRSTCSPKCTCWSQRNPFRSRCKSSTMDAQSAPWPVCTMAQLVERCISVQKSLRSIALKTEIAALHSLLYIFHNRLSFHKPYLALKQNLSEEMQYCLVPSQPILELASVKILGACKLLLRLLDCCCKAFQYLFTAVLYRSILKKLISLYGSQYSLQQEVSSFQNMPYIKNFTFPAKMEDYLGPVFTDLAKTKLPKISLKKDLPKMLNKMFSSPELNANAKKLKKPAELNVPKAKEKLLDLGKPVNAPHLNRGNYFFLPAPHILLTENSRVSRQASKIENTLSHCRNRTKCIKHLVPRIEKAECFRDLNELLQHAITWCKRRRFAAGAIFFRNKSLKSNRLMHVESHGYWYVCIFILGLHIYIWKHKVTRSHRSRAQKSGLHINSQAVANRSDAEEPGMCLDLGHVDLAKSSAVTDITAFPHALETRRRDDSPDRKVNADTDDIDDIFLSIGI